MDKKKILDWLVQEAESKAQAHYRKYYRKPRQLASLDHALCWLNKHKEMSLPEQLPHEASKMIPVLKKHFNNKVSFISLVLHHHFPREYFFYRPSKLDKEIVAGLDFFSDVVPEFGLPFSQVGGRNLRNYLRLNEALLRFARRRWPLPKDFKNYQDRLMYFLYEGLGRPFVEKGYHPPYWLMVTGPDFFGSLDNNKSLDWSGAREMQVGDTVFMYRKLPRAAITDIYRVATQPRFIPWDGWDGFDVDIDKLCSIKHIPFSQLKADDIIGEWGVVKKALVGTVAVPVPPRVSNSLLDIIPKTIRRKHNLAYVTIPEPPEDFPHRPTLATPQYGGDFALEADFEKRVIVPLLKRWGFGRKPQYGFRYRTGSEYRTALVDFLVSHKGEPLTLFEDKLQIVNDEDLQLYVDQAKTYALLLGLPSFVVASPEGMWLYALDGGQEQLIKPIPTAGTHKEQEDKFKSLLLQMKE